MSLRTFAYHHTCGFTAIDDHDDVTELRAELRPGQIAIGLRCWDDGPQSWTVELLLPFATVTLSKNEVPF